MEEELGGERLGAWRVGSRGSANPDHEWLKWLSGGTLLTESWAFQAKRSVHSHRLCEEHKDA